MPLNPVPNYPGSLDSLPDPTAATYEDDDGFEIDLLLQKLNAIAELLEAKLGISESSAQDTPIANALMASLTNAKSKWTTSPTVSGTFTAGAVAVSGNGAIVPAAVVGTPAQNGLYSGNFTKGWAKVTVSAGTPTNAGSFNVSGITDNGVGDLTVTWDRDLSSAHYGVRLAWTGASAVIICQVAAGGQAAGSLQVVAFTLAGAAVDPATWYVSADGVQ